MTTSESQISGYYRPCRRYVNINIARRACTQDRCYPPAAAILSVLRHLRIDALRPRGNSTSEVVYVSEAGLLEQSYGFGASSAHLAMGYNLALGVELVQAVGQIIERNKMSAEVADLIF